MKGLIKAILPLVLLVSCTSSEKRNTEALALEFFEKFKSRNDWSGFKNLYADNLVFEDVIYRLKFNKDDFFSFYNWPDTLFEKHPDFPETLVLQDLSVTDSSAVGRGYFNPFYYKGALLSKDHHWRFTMWLYFDEEGRIKRHIDFIEYPPVFLQSAAESIENQ